MATSNFLLIFFLFISLLYTSTAEAITTKHASLKLKLIHRHSPDSPFRKPYANRREHLGDLIRDDERRLHGFQKLLDRNLPVPHDDLPTSSSLAFRGHGNILAPVISGAAAGSGQYIVDFTVGTPPQHFMLVADTGSDLLWVKCSGCRDRCLRKPGTAFFARRSRTFSPIHCYAPACELVPGPPDATCNATKEHSSCMYEYVYADLSDSTGVFARDTATLNASDGSRVRVRGVAFGCGMHSTGPSFSGPSFGSAHGVMGLGKGAISFVSQIGRKVGDKFSYCLVDYTASPPRSSYLFIGHHGSIHRPVHYTPLIHNKFAETFYYLGVEKLWIGDRVLRLPAKIWEIDSRGNGGTIIDSGTTLTFLAGPAYGAVLKAYEKSVKYPKVSHAFEDFDLCYNVSGIRHVHFPRFRISLKGNVRFEPPTSNYFINAAEGVRCLALRGVSSRSGFSIIGNLMQQNFYIVYDRERSRLGFSQTDCASVNSL